MRCFNCNKNFDYDKHYGICPKCGCFNQKETQAERHEDLHDRFGDESDHGEDYGYRQPQPFPSYQDTQAESAGNTEAFGTAPPYGKAETKRGGGALAVGIIVLLIGLVVLVSGSLAYSTDDSSPDEEDSTLQLIAHEAGESFEFQQGSIQVLEARNLADQESLPNLAGGMKLIAVHIAGQSDGEYEDYNKVLTPYIEIDGKYRRALSYYDFEPYGQMLGAYPALDEYVLMEESFCDGWYGFLAEEDVTEIRIWFDEYDGSGWDGGKLLAGHYVDLALEDPAALGGGTDGQ